ncbi:MAG: ATP synthase F0 subunit C [Planctomycetota bacterium]|nr:ATP synthase F0 subunit C [Planctomycetota bacterium]
MANAVNQAAVAAQAGGAEPVAQATEKLGPGLALGLAVLGAGLGIGKLAASALEGTARQPEAAGKLQGMMILAIAFIEALALIALLFGAFVI